jgi:uncharacterized membrane protein YcaP (DUF421 family)
VNNVFFHSWSDVIRVVVATTILFAAVIAVLRVVGAQALARMSAYDMIAGVTFGSLIATVAVTRAITLAEGCAALLTVFLLQEGLRFFQSRWLGAHHALRQPAFVLVWNGQLLEDRLLKHNISADEVRAAIRKQGLASIADARIVVLENDGAWSVIPKSAQVGDDSALHGLPIPGRPGNSPVKGGSRAIPAPANRLP